MLEPFEFPESGRALVEYLECGSEEPSGIKMIQWGSV
jgi:hypothetical protein